MSLIPRLLTAHVTREKPFCLLGAAGTGKTSFLKEYASLFSNFIRLDLETAEDRAVAAPRTTLEEWLKAVSFLKSREIRGTGTLLILDEIGHCPETVRWIAGQASGTAPTAAGRVRIDPVSRPFMAATSSVITPDIVRLTDPSDGYFRPLFLSPFSFEEYLTATGDGPSLEMFREVPAPAYAHNKLLRHFHHYSLVGGMPAVVNAWAGSGRLTDLSAAYEKTEERLLQHLPLLLPGAKTRGLAAEVQRNSYPYAATRIAFRGFGNLGKGSREIGRAFRSLEQLLFCRLVPPCTATNFDSPADERLAPRLHLLDTGMVNYFSGIQKPLFGAQDMNALFGGQIARQAVGQELAALAATTFSTGASAGRMPPGLPAPGFWVRRKAQSTAGVDFVLPHHDLLIPIVVRSGEPGRLRALHQFIDAAPHPYAVRLHAGPLGVREARTLHGTRYFLLSLPYFLAGRIREHLEGFMKYVNR